MSLQPLNKPTNEMKRLKLKPNNVKNIRPYIVSCHSKIEQIFNIEQNEKDVSFPLNKSNFNRVPENTIIVCPYPLLTYAISQAKDEKVFDYIKKVKGTPEILNLLNPKFFDLQLKDSPIVFNGQIFDNPEKIEKELEKRGENLNDFMNEYSEFLSSVRPIGRRKKEEVYPVEDRELQSVVHSNIYYPGQFMPNIVLNFKKEDDNWQYLIDDFETSGDRQDALDPKISKLSRFQKDEMDEDLRERFNIAVDPKIELMKRLRKSEDRSIPLYDFSTLIKPHDEKINIVVVFGCQNVFVDIMYKEISLRETRLQKMGTYLVTLDMDRGKLSEFLPEEYDSRLDTVQVEDIYSFELQKIGKLLYCQQKENSRQFKKLEGLFDDKAVGTYSLVMSITPPLITLGPKSILAQYKNDFALSNDSQCKSKLLLEQFQIEKVGGVYNPKIIKTQIQNQLKRRFQHISQQKKSRRSRKRRKRVRPRRSKKPSKAKMPGKSNKTIKKKNKTSVKRVNKLGKKRNKNKHYKK